MLEDAAHQPWADLLGALIEERGQLVQRVLWASQRRRGEEPLLVAEEVIDHRNIHAGIGGNRADGGPLVPVAHETFARRVDDALLGLLTGAPPARASGFRHARQHTSTLVDVRRRGIVR